MLKLLLAPAVYVGGLLADRVAASYTIPLIGRVDELAAQVEAIPAHLTRTLQEWDEQQVVVVSPDQDPEHAEAILASLWERAGAWTQ